jgi:cobalamin biosynthesis Mg chelatase CobN
VSASERQTPPRAAVVDLGSNSVRLVVFEGRGRNPVAIFNEKAVLRLGRGLETTGLLNEEGVVQALQVMRRYYAIARAMGAEPFEVLATAAVRDARNGGAFVDVLDERMREFFARSNPWALHGIAERLLEAAERKLWDAPDPATLAALRQAYLETEGDLEDR